MYAEQLKKLLDYAIKLLSIRPRSTWELKHKLVGYAVKHKQPVKQIEEVISRLLQQNLLNDEEFVRWWVWQRKTFRPKGGRLLAAELSARGVDKETISKVLADSSGEYEDAKNIAYKKAKLLAKLPLQQSKTKLSELLESRGFSWETIKRVIDEMNVSPYNKG